MDLLWKQDIGAPEKPGTYGIDGDSKSLVVNQKNLDAIGRLSSEAGELRVTAVQVSKSDRGVPLYRIVTCGHLPRA